MNTNSTSVIENSKHLVNEINTHLLHTSINND